MAFKGKFTVDVSKEELEEAAKNPDAALALTKKYRDMVSDPVRSSLLGSDLKEFQESRKNLKRKAEAKPWTPSKTKPWQKTPRDEFNGVLGRKGGSGA